MSRQPRIGIYAGTFDPVHAGHISFALQAMEAAKLDFIYFLPERRPRDKYGVEHFGHRVAMLKRACQPHTTLAVLELEDITFTVDRTLTRLKKHFPKTQLVFLVGSDVIWDLPTWPNVDRLLSGSELMVGIRARDKQERVMAAISTWEMQPKAVTVIDSYAAEVSSGSIREALRKRQDAQGLLTSVARYSNHHWLYVSLA